MICVQPVAPTNFGEMIDRARHPERSRGIPWKIDRHITGSLDFARDDAAFRYRSSLRERLPGRGLWKRIAVFSPGEMAILTIEFLRENFHRKKNTGDSRRDELSRQLRILDPGRLALGATNRRADLGIARFPLEHQFVRL